MLSADAVISVWGKNGVDDCAERGAVHRADAIKAAVILFLIFIYIPSCFISLSIML
jgi:hypothetical protein